MLTISSIWYYSLLVKVPECTMDSRSCLQCIEIYRDVIGSILLHLWLSSQLFYFCQIYPIVTRLLLDQLSAIFLAWLLREQWCSFIACIYQMLQILVHITYKWLYQIIFWLCTSSSAWSFWNLFQTWVLGWNLRELVLLLFWNARFLRVMSCLGGL